MMTRLGHVSFLPSVMVLLLATMKAASAQPDADAGGPRVELELEGGVERVFVSDDRSDDTRLVQLALRSVALADAHIPLRHVRVPAPGDVLFVVVGDSSDNGRLPRAESGELPRAGERIRAKVRDDGRGVWTAAGSNWFETIESALRRPEREVARDDDPGTPNRFIDLRGMRCEAKGVRGQLGLEVVQVQSEGPAHDAGFQVGDVIVAVGGSPISSVANVERLALEPKPLALAVLDVNSGRLANVTLAASPTAKVGRSQSAGPRDEPGSDPASRIADAIGISVETTRVGVRGAVKVATVEPARPAAMAGLEPGDVIVAVNRTRVANVDDFAQALPAQGGQVTLVVRDVRTGEEVPVEVRAVGARSTDNDRPQTPDTSTSASEGVTTDRFGIAGELTFYNEEAAVKVVSVKPGSPASRAGIRPGWVILKANDEPVLHPDDLEKAEEAAGGRLSLRVADPSTDRQSTIDIQR
jgi:S1-C subfamily serine protease